MRRNINKRKKGFTLIELLIVIGIIAVLALAVIFTLSPAELLREARDSNRLSDMALLKTSISLYLTDVTVPNINGGANQRCYGSYGPTSTAACAVPFITANSSVASISRAVNGSGWLPVNLGAIVGGSPIGVLPLDPINDVNYYYLYISTSSPGITFKLAARIESAKYSSGGPSDVVSNDGGSSGLWYETGTELTL
jgi:prepilin-type N-terminal cleavage/methylation domain-containing protein